MIKKLVLLFLITSTNHSFSVGPEKETMDQTSTDYTTREWCMITYGAGCGLVSSILAAIGTTQPSAWEPICCFAACTGAGICVARIARAKRINAAKKHKTD